MSILLTDRYYVHFSVSSENFVIYQGNFPYVLFSSPKVPSSLIVNENFLRIRSAHLEILGFPMGGAY